MTGESITFSYYSFNVKIEHYNKNKIRRTRTDLFQTTDFKSFNRVCLPVMIVHSQYFVHGSTSTSTASSKPQ